MHSMCTSYVLNAYLYCVYALVGGAISIRDPYVVCAVSRVCAKESHAVFHRPVVSENVAIGFKPTQKLISWGKSARTPELLEVGILRHNF